MLSKIDLIKLAEVRLEDSVFLFKAGKTSSAYYLAGYCIELSLKACISGLFQPNTIPDKSFVQAIHTHSLDSLLNVAGLFPIFKEDAKNDSLFAAYWGITSKWNESSRYQFWDQFATLALIQSITDTNHGVFQWVKKHW
jgi:hypothetical protein